MVTIFIKDRFTLHLRTMREKEIYKGIEFVRLSTLPDEQSERIRASFPKEKIIKILKDEIILRDCIQYQDYQDWFRKSYQASLHVTANKTERIATHSYNLSLK